MDVISVGSTFVIYKSHEISCLGESGCSSSKKAAQPARSLFRKLILGSVLSLCMMLLFNGMGAQTFSVTWNLTSNANVSSTSGPVTGSAMVAGSGIGSRDYDSNGVHADDWDSGSRNLNDYYEYKITPTTGSSLTVTSISFIRRINDSDGLTAAVYYSLNNFSTSSQIGSNISVTTSYVTTNLTTSVEVPSGTTFSIRIYGWDADDDNDNFHNKTVVISGAACAAPDAPGSISGTASVCPGQSGVSYSVGAVSGATSYSWSYSGTGFTPSGTGNSITGSFSSNATSGDLTVSATNSCGTGIASATYPITIKSAPSSISASSSASEICAGQTINLSSSSPSPPTTLLSEDFNAGTNDWTRGNSSSGGNTGNAAWTLRADNYSNDGVTFSSNDDSQFYLSNSRAQNGSVTSTTLTSPSISTVGYSALSLNFWHYFRFDSDNNESARVQVSTNGSSWTTVATYTSTQGSGSSFDNETISLSSYVGESTLYLRFFYYTEERSRYWAIDNVVLTGTPLTLSYSWTSSPSGYTSSAQNPTGVAPSSSISYTAAVTNSLGCSLSSSAVPVAVNQPASQPGAFTVSSSAVCRSTTGVTYTVPNDNTVSYSWGYSGTGATINGSGNSVTVDFSSTATSGNLTVTATASNGCTPSASRSISVTTNARPTSSVTGSENVCAGNSTSLNIAVTGTGTISGVLSPGSINFSGTAPAISVNITPGSTATYTVASLNDQNCSAISGGMTGSRVVNYRARPVGTITAGTTTVCSTSPTTNIKLVTTGSGTLSGTLSPGNIAFSGNPSVILVPVSPSSTTTYTIGTLSDQYCPATSLNGNAKVTVNQAVTYYADSDGDGYGDSGVSQTICGSAPSGYVLDGTDCDDDNSDKNPGAGEWFNGEDDDCDGQVDEGVSGTTFYRDEDGDGYGSSGNSVVAFEQPTGYVLNDDDCNDAVSTAHPGATEICNGIDDDCDGLVDENCGPVNDEKGSALQLIVRQFGQYITQNGTLIGATSSANAGASVVTGEDVWFYFEAPTAGIRIQCPSPDANVLLELQTQTGTLVDTENIRSDKGLEIMNYGGLTPGETYYLRVRNYDSSQGTGHFQLCANRVEETRGTSGSGPFSLCQVYKAKWTGANQYVFNFTPTSGGSTLSGSSSGGITTIQLALVPGLVYGTSYNVRVDAVYNLTDGLGNIEPLSVTGVAVLSLNTSFHTDLDLAVQDQCPPVGNARSRNATIGSQTWICGANYYEWEFRPENEEFSYGVYGPPINRFVSLGTVPQIAPGSTYDVRIRPWFVNGSIPGDWGPDWQCLQIIAPTSGDGHTNGGEQSIGSIASESEVTMTIYPNPQSGGELVVQASGLTGKQAEIRIYNSVGSLVRQMTTSLNAGSLFTQIDLDGDLPPGVYEVSILHQAGRDHQKLLITR